MPKTDEGAPGPAMIFLEPPCDSYAPEGRQWCEDDVWDEGGVPYVRSDLALRTPAGEAGEMVAWAWLDEMVSALCDEEPSDIAYSADQMVDAFMAGQRLSATDTEAMRQEIINSPETRDFMAGVPIEAAHQRDRWGADHDAGKQPLDWFWLIGYLAQKAATAHMAGDSEKALHHTVSTAAALANWHAAISGADNRMRPGIDALAKGGA